MGSYAEFASLLQEVSAQYRLPPGLLAAIVAQESNFDPQAVGDNGCSFGLGQLNRCGGAGSGYTAEQLFDPALNLALAAAYLRQQFERYGDWLQAISAYNAGHATMSNADYVQAVLDKWQRHYGGLSYTEGTGFAYALVVLLTVALLALFAKRFAK